MIPELSAEAAGEGAQEGAQLNKGGEPMVSLNIDGKDIQIEKGATILAAAEKAGIRIPTLCYLKKISPTGACRICVVEVEGSSEPQTACNTPAMAGMVVRTRSERLARIRRQVVELLLVNHPLDCPVCDAAGECDLQESCYEQDVERQPFAAEDINPAAIENWPLIQQVPSRCILCEKCVKVCHEVVGAGAIEVRHCGDRAFIDTHDGEPLACEFCGGCVQSCPTGTLLSKPFKHSARPWALTKVASVCANCSCQCQLDYNVLGGRVMRVTSEDGVTRNDGNLCIGGFFAYDAIHADSRIETPRLDGSPCGWDQAMETVSGRLLRIVEKDGGSAVAGLCGGSLTNEEAYLFQKLFRAGLGSNNIDTPARLGALRSLQTLQRTLGLRGASNRIEAIAESEAVLVFGADVTAEAPAVDWQIQKACRKNDGKLVLANLRRTKLSRFSNVQLLYKPGSEVALANALGKLILEMRLADDAFIDRFCENAEELRAHLSKVDLEQASRLTGLSEASLRESARILGEAGSVSLVFGSDLTRSGDAEDKVAALSNLAILSGALHGEIGGLFPLDELSNIQGLLDQGVYAEALPGYQPYGSARGAFEKAWGRSLPEGGLDASGILEGIEQGSIKALYLSGVNPALSFPEAERWKKALSKLELLAVQDPFESALTRMAHVVLPSVTGAEKRGTLTSLDHRINSLAAALSPQGQSRDDFSVFAALLQRLLPGAAPDMAGVRKEMKQLCGLYPDTAFEISGEWLKQMYAPKGKALEYVPVVASGQAPSGLQLLCGSILFHFGVATTHSQACLSIVPEGKLGISPQDAARLGVSEGARIRLSSARGSIEAPATLCGTLPEGLLFAPHNFEDMPVQSLVPQGANLAAVELTKL